jgi:hypothetical protein
MGTGLQDKKGQVINEEEQLETVNQQDDTYRDTTATEQDKKKGYSEGNRNDSGTAEETTDDIQPKENDQETGKDATGK